MWRDILIIVGFVLAGLTYFGLTPRRLSEYAKTAKGEVIKRSFGQKVYLSLMVAFTVFYIFLIIWNFGIFKLTDFLLGIAIFTAAWCSILEDVWKISKSGEKAVTIVGYSVVLPLLVATVILSDMLLWQKLAYSLGGVCLGVVIGILRKYKRKKWEDRCLSEERDK
jgi:hypothetical protein